MRELGLNLNWDLATFKAPANSKIGTVSAVLAEALRALLETTPDDVIDSFSQRGVQRIPNEICGAG